MNKILTTARFDFFIDYPLTKYSDVVIFIRNFEVDCVHALVGVGVYFTPIPINIIDLTVYGLK